MKSKRQVLTLLGSINLYERAQAMKAIYGAVDGSSREDSNSKAMRRSKVAYRLDSNKDAPKDALPN